MNHRKACSFAVIFCQTVGEAGVPRWSPLNRKNQLPNSIEHVRATLKKLLQKKLHKMKRKVSFIVKTCLLLCA